MDKKMCSGCERVLPIKDFYKDKYSADDRKSLCRACAGDAFITYYAKNKERLIQKRMEYAKENRDKTRAAQSRWRKKHPDKNREYVASAAERYREMWRTGELVLPAEAKCVCCEEVLQISEFYIAHNRKQGHSSYCKRCTKEKSKKYREEHKPKILLDMSWKKQITNNFNYWKRAKEMQNG